MKPSKTKTEKVWGLRLLKRNKIKLAVRRVQIIVLLLSQWWQHTQWREAHNAFNGCAAEHFIKC